MGRRLRSDGTRGTGGRPLRRGEVYWASLPAPRGRRPILILTRSRAIPLLRSVVVAPITTTSHRVPAELPLGAPEGLNRRSFANCDNLHSVEKTLIDPRPVGRLAHRRIEELDAALRFALQIR